MSANLTKPCRICGETKALDLFSRRAGSADGYRTDCKACVVQRTTGRDRRAYNRAYREANAERLAEYARRHPATRTPEWWRAYREANREAMLATEARYRRANRDKEAARRHERRALPMDDAAREWIRILLADPCAYCGGAGGTVDHIVPVKHGGTNDWTNLTAACGSCNSSKRTRPLLTHLLTAVSE